MQTQTVNDSTVMQTLTVFYTPVQNVENNVSYSPSAGKPAKVLADWRKRGLPVTVITPVPVTVDELCRAHDRQYVEGVLSGEVANGFRNHSPEVAASLPWTCGSFCTAARYAVKTGQTVVSLTSGFHHANYAHNWGFCTFNGLMVALMALRADGYTRKIGILDLDAHPGDGTEDILKRLGLDNYEHYSFGYAKVSRGNAEEWISRRFVKALEAFADCGVIFYQAGADPHVDDPLGGFLTTQQMHRRDRLVFEFARKHNIPVVWNLAGGYQDDFEQVLQLHATTAETCLDVFGANPSTVATF